MSSSVHEMRGASSALPRGRWTLAGLASTVPMDEDGWRLVSTITVEGLISGFVSRVYHLDSTEHRPIG